MIGAFTFIALAYCLADSIERPVAVVNNPPPFIKSSTALKFGYGILYAGVISVPSKSVAIINLLKILFLSGIYSP